MIDQLRQATAHAKWNEAGAIESMQDTELRLAQTRCLLEYGVENGANLAGRGADHAQDLGRRGLLVEGLTQLARARLYLLEQARILDGDHRLVGEDLQETDLLFGEWPHFIAANQDVADGNALRK